MTELSTYRDFLSRKQDYGARHGFEPTYMPDFLFDFQTYLVDWAVRLGRAAIFADCGMGKTPMQLVWAQNVIEHTNKPVLILTPLAVSGQTLDEADKFGIEATRAVPGEAPALAVNVINYEQLQHFDSLDYGGVVCDESSILKNFNGVRRGEITEFMRRVPYRLLCTATAAPNDWTELGTSSEALGYLGHTDMLTKFFTNKARSGTVRSFQNRRDKWRLKGHAAEGPFWQWLSSWSRAARRPSDLGFDDDGFILPELRECHTIVKASTPRPGMLFDVPATNFHEEREVRRRTIEDRCEEAAGKVARHDISMVWCNLNDESDTLAAMIPGAVAITGSDSLEAKEEAARWFVNGDDQKRVLVSKPSIFGFGLNFQHCAHMTYFPTHSYEQYYQAVRRLWRFGQKRPVTVDHIYSDGGKLIIENLQRKGDAADEMFTEMVRYMDKSLKVKDTYTHINLEVPQWIGK